MLYPQGTTVAVADGSKLSLFRNTASQGAVSLTAVPHATPDQEHNSGAGARHQDSAANPDHGQWQEDNFAAGVATLLNDQVTAGTIEKLVVIAAPKTLGELRKHYSKQLEATLLCEIPKDLTGHTTQQIEQALTTSSLAA